MSTSDGFFRLATRAPPAYCFPGNASNPVVSHGT